MITVDKGALPLTPKGKKGFRHHYFRANHKVRSGRKNDLRLPLRWNPYMIFIDTGNPEPMIEALTLIKDKLPKRTNEVNL